MKMLKQIVIAALLLLSVPVFSQKMGFVDSDLILNKLPEYKSAQKTLDDLSAQYQSKANEMQLELDQIWKDFKAEEILLTADQKKMKEENIVAKEKELFEYREKMFGPTGELFKKRQELVKPIQDKVYEAIQAVCKKEGIAIMFDKAGGNTILYANPNYDKTIEVLEQLGVATTEEEKKPGQK